MSDIILPIDQHTSTTVNQLAEFLSKQSVEAYLVGGYIRDALLRRYTRDVDIAISGDATTLAQEVAEHFNGKFLLLGNTKSVARVILPEVHLDFSTMQGTIAEDLDRRDFSINAMAVNFRGIAKNSAIIDPNNGYKDIKQKVVRVINENAFMQDPIRLLRAIRHASQLGFAIDEKTKKLLERDSALITQVAEESICDEVCAIIATKMSHSSLRQMDELGLISPLFPELAACKGVEQPKEHNWDVFDHSIETVAAVNQLFKDMETGQNGLSEIPWTDELADHFNEEISSGHLRITILKIAALLHDLGKPVTKGIQENGRMRFLGHSSQGAQMARNIMTRLRFSAKEIKMVERIIEQHMRPTQLSSNWEMPTHRAIYRYFRDTENDAFDILLLSLADHLAARGPSLDAVHWAYHIQLIKYVMHKYSVESSIVKPPKLLDGNDLIKLGFDPGPKMGIVLEAIREAQAAGEITSTEDAINLAKRLFN